MKIAFIGGSWSSNIGNAFYNLGTDAFLRMCLGVESYFIPDPPQWKAPTENDFDLIGNLAVDLVILTGPCLNLKLESIFRRTFTRLKKRGVKIGFISAGMSLYDEGEAIIVAKFLNEFKPEFIFTRDSEVIDLLKDKVQDIQFYDGLCTSMFLNDSVDLPSLDIDTYYVFNFDKTEEPLISKLGNDYVFERYKKSFLNKNKFQVDIEGVPIIRTNNEDIGVGYPEIYKIPETYHSDLPYGYLTILKNAKTVFSERVHTCAATLVLGGTAQFMPLAKRSHEKRSNIFHRIGLSDIFDKPTKIDFDFLNNEKNKMVEAFSTIISSF